MKPSSLKWALPVLFLLGALPAFADPFVSNSASDYGAKVTDLAYIMMALCLVFFLLVVGIIAVCLWKFRAKGPNEEGAAIHGHAGLEIIWTIVPAIIMLGLGAVSTVLVIEQLNPPSNILLVKVTGYQFGFDFDFYQEDSTASSADAETIRNICGNPAVMVKIRSLHVKSTDELMIPDNTNIRFLTTSKDVIHSFWVPEFLIKKDMVPGLVADFWVHTTRAGQFTARCAALCGTDHAAMIAKVNVVDQQTFKNWLASQSAASAAIPN